MTATTYDGRQEPRRGTAVLVLLGAAVAVLVLMGLSRVQTWPRATPRTDAPPIELPPLTAHALEHADARVAWDWVRAHGQFCKWSCPDGATRYVCGMSRNRWAVVVIGVTGRLVTAFPSDQEYAKGVIDGCRNPWRMAHP